jgi:non-specific serine/threonine protein kinase
VFIIRSVAESRMVDSASAPHFRAPPIARTRLFGRETERAAARALLLDEAVPLLTLTGPGGVGKTRLALTIAADVGGQFADGVVFVDLAPLADGPLVPATVAAALGIVAAPGRPVGDELARVLRPRQALLLLDNCEHLLPAAAELAGALLPRCPALQLLATSRAPLRVRGEQEFPVDPLPLPPEAIAVAALTSNEAVRLFAARARAVRPTFRLDETNATAVAALCRCLDGLPLAIELAAAHSKMHAPGTLLAQMTDQWRLLGDGPRDAPARQQTMRDTIAWSYDLLDPPVQSLFRRLAVFAGGFSPAAGKAVAGAESEASDFARGLAALVDQNLVRQVEPEQSSEPRFAMLETVREFGQEQLAAAGEDAPTRALHAAFYRDLAVEYDLEHHYDDMHEDDRWWSRFIDDQDNLRQALSWIAERGDALELNSLCAALTTHWRILAQFDEGRRWLGRAMANDAGVPLAIRASVRGDAGWLADHHGAYDAAEPLLDEGLALARETGDPVLISSMLVGRGMLAFKQEHLALADALLDEAERIVRDLGAEGEAGTIRIASALSDRGNIAAVAGDDALAIERFTEAVRLSRVPGGAWVRSHAVCGLGCVWFRQGGLEEPAACFIETLALAWKLHDHAFLARLFWAIAATAARSGRPETAARLLGAADAADARIGGAIWPLDRELADWSLARLATELPALELAELRRAGTDLSLDQGVAAAYAAAEAILGQERVAAIWQEAGAPAPPLLTDPKQTTPDQNRDVLAAALVTNLTGRERDVFGLLCQHLTDAEIAERLFLSTRTVSHHVSSILGKLGAANRRVAVAFAARLDVI